MASLKEIRGRINSISTTLKITDVTRMIASAKLHKTRMVLERFRPYETKIKEVLVNLLCSNSDGSSNSPYSVIRKQNKLIVVAISSNSSLCGAFNMNVIKKTSEILQNNKSQNTEIILYAIGKKIYDAFAKYDGITVKGPYNELLETCTYEHVSNIADELMKLFVNKEADKIEVVHNKFKNILTQYVIANDLLPISLSPTPPTSSNNFGSDKSGDIATLTSNKPANKKVQTDYIIEPSKDQLLQYLVPSAIRLSLFGMVLESTVSEHAARSSAMQTATDNANKIIADLTKQYNRMRQAVITKEIIDIVGGAEALR